MRPNWLYNASGGFRVIRSAAALGSLRCWLVCLRCCPPPPSPIAGRRTSPPSRRPTARRRRPRARSSSSAARRSACWDLRRRSPTSRRSTAGSAARRWQDSTRYVDRIVVPYSPRIVVVYAGDNDIMGIPSEQIAIAFERFVRAVHAKLPDTRILYIGIKPSLLRWGQVDRMRQANAMIRQFCERDDRLGFRGHRQRDARLGREAAQGALRRRRPAPHGRRLPDPERAGAAVPAAAAPPPAAGVALKCVRLFAPQRALQLGHERVHHAGCAAPSPGRRS